MYKASLNLNSKYDKDVDDMFVYNYSFFKMISVQHQLVGLMEKEDFNYFHTSMRTRTLKIISICLEEKD